MQGVTVAVATMFGVLWLRAVKRVRAAVQFRSSVLQRVQDVLTGLPPQQLAVVMYGVSRLQRLVRWRCGHVHAQRARMMDAYEAASEDRR